MSRDDPCDKTNCICDKMLGWPQQTEAGFFVHLHNTEPRVAGSGVGGVNEP